MHLVDDQDHVAESPDLVDEPLDTRFKLSAELRSCHDGSQVHQMDLLVLQLIGHLTRNDALCQRLGNGSLAHARLADEAGIVFLMAAKNLHKAGKFSVSSNDLPKLSFSCLIGQISAVKGEVLSVLVLFSLFTLSLLFVLALLRARGRSLVLHGQSAKQLSEINGRGVADRLITLLLGQGQIARLQHLGHFQIHTLDILVGDAHFLHNVVHRLDAQLLSTLQANALVDGLILLHTGDEDHRRALFATRTYSHIHFQLTFFPFADSSAGSWV